MRSVDGPGWSRPATACSVSPAANSALDDVVVQVGGDPLALVEHCRPLLLVAGIGQLERDGA